MFRIAGLRVDTINGWLLEADLMFSTFNICLLDQKTFSIQLLPIFISISVVKWNMLF